jgi:SAM-dependent methyltransferase
MWHLCQSAPPASSTNRQSAFTSRISSIDLQSASSSRGEQTSSTRHCAREVATLLRDGAALELDDELVQVSAFRTRIVVAVRSAGSRARVAGRDFHVYDRHPMDRDEYKRTSLENWQTMAAGWESRRAEIEKITRPVSEWMVEALDPQPGDTVLELAAGPGDVGYLAAPLLGADGRLISSDFSSEMVEVARRRAAELGLENVEHRVIDAEEIALEDDSVDGALCRFGFMLMPDPDAAVAETRRVLRPGGRLALAVWGQAGRNPWIALAGRVLAERGLAPPPQPGEPGMFVLAEEERLRGLLESAGFGVERIDEVPVLFEYSSVDEYIAAANETGGMFARIWRAASEEEHETIEARLAEAFEPFAVDGGYELPGVAAVAVAS